MAELQQSSYASQAESSPVMKVKAAQAPTRDVDQGVGDAKFAEAEIWKAAVGFTDKVLATAAKNISLQADQERADEIIDDIRTQAINNFAYIEDELPKLPGSKIKPDEIMESFENRTNENFGYQDIEKYEGYEGLAPQFRKQIKDQYRNAKKSTQEEIIKQMADLSSLHTMRNLGMKGLSVQGEIAGIVNNEENIIVNIEPDEQVMDFIKSYEGGPPGYADNFKRLIASGEGVVIPGLGRATKAEDLGVKGGFTKEAETQINQALERYSQETFDALDKQTIKMEDVEKLHATAVQGVLQQQFLAEYRKDPVHALTKAEQGQYKYKKNFTGFSGEGETIDYVLKQDWLQTYIEREHVARSKAPTADPIAIAELKGYISDQDGSITMEQAKALAMGNNRFKGDPRAIATIMNFAHGINSDRLEKANIEDKDNLVNGIVADIGKNMDNISKYFNATGDEDTWQLKSIEELQKIVPDSIVKRRKTEWKKGDTGYEYLTGEEVIVTKGANRQGIKLLKQTDFASLLVQHQKKDQNRRSTVFASEYNNIVAYPSGARKFLSQVTKEDQNLLDYEKLNNYLNPKSSLGQTPLGKTLQYTFNDRKEDAVNVMNSLIGKASKTTKNKTNKKFLLGSDPNEKAFDAALQAQHMVDIRNMQNVASGVDPKDKSIADVSYSPMAIFEKEMIENGNEKGLTKDQLKKYDYYQDIQGKLQQIQNDLHILPVSQLKAYQKEFANGDMTYQLNKRLSEVIEDQVGLRIAMLQDKDLAFKILMKEATDGDYWEQEFPLTHIKDDRKRLKQRIQLMATQLGASSQIMSGKRDNSKLINILTPLKEVSKAVSTKREELSKSQERLDNFMSMSNTRNREN